MFGGHEAEDFGLEPVDAAKFAAGAQVSTSTDSQSHNHDKWNDRELGTSPSRREGIHVVSTGQACPERCRGRQRECCLSFDLGPASFELATSSRLTIAVSESEIKLLQLR